MHVGEINGVKRALMKLETLIEHSGNLEEYQIALKLVARTIEKLLKQSRLSAKNHEKERAKYEYFLEVGRVNCAFCEFGDDTGYGITCYNINCEHYQKSITEIPEKRCKLFKVEVK